LYQKAVQLDPGFAAAYARLSLAAGGIRWGNLDPGHAAEWLGKEETNAQQALALDSALPEAHVAMGFYRYWGRHDYQGALEQFDVALRAEPNNALFMESKAAIFKRTGDFAASAALNARASDLDPLAWSPPLEAWIGYSLIRDYDQAERYVERFVSLSPGHEWRVAYTRIWQHGNAFAVRESLTTTLGEAGTIRIAASAAHGENFPSQGHALVRMLCGDCVAAIPMVQSDRPQDWQRYEAIGLLYWQAGRARKARVYYDSARVRQEASRQSPAIADARLGRRQEAVSAAKQELWNGREAADRLSEIDGVQQLAQVYIMVGEYDAALDQLEWLMAHPSWLSVGLLKADPLYDPLRNNPRFQALIAKYDEPSRH
jgi:tetratricopeptide (TPR) repeat protein